MYFDIFYSIKNINELLKLKRYLSLQCYNLLLLCLSINYISI